MARSTLCRDASAQLRVAARAATAAARCKTHVMMLKATLRATAELARAHVMLYDEEMRQLRVFNERRLERKAKQTLRALAKS